MTHARPGTDPLPAAASASGPDRLLETGGVPPGAAGRLLETERGEQDRASETGGDRPAVELRGARMALGDRVLWDGLDLDVRPGEFVAVLGPNGSGKTTLLKVLLGQRALTAGTVRVAGTEPGGRGRAAESRVGYVPQQRALDPDLPLRGRDLVAMGLDGHRFGPALRGRAERRAKVRAALAAVGATGYADAPVGLLSGGEQQRLRVAQALVGDPDVLLCDEPLLSLDLANQRVVSELIDRRRAESGTAVLFVTHEINPVLSMVDRVLYLVGGRFRIGTPDEVMSAPVLSELYRTDIEVLRLRGRLVVVGAQDDCCHPLAHGDLA